MKFTVFVLVQLPPFESVIVSVKVSEPFPFIVVDLFVVFLSTPESEYTVVFPAFNVIFTVLGVIIGKKIYGLRRKQKANELNDDFEYVSASEVTKGGNQENAITGNIRNNNFSINAPVSNYKSIEMNTNLY